VVIAAAVVTGVAIAATVAVLLGVLLSVNGTSKFEKLLYILIELRNTTFKKMFQSRFRNRSLGISNRQLKL